MLRTQNAIANSTLKNRKRQDGVMLLEALIAILIFSIGILAVVGAAGGQHQNVTDSKHRTEAAFLAKQAGCRRCGPTRGNIASYAYPGSGGRSDRLTDWWAR